MGKTSQRKRKKKGISDEERAYLAGQSAFAPTKEQVAKAPYGYEAEVIAPGGRGVPPVERHKQRSTLDTFRKYFDEEDLQAFARFCFDAEAATKHNLTSHWDKSLDGVRGPRHGGVYDRSRLAYLRFEEVKARLPRQCRELCEKLVLAVRSEQLNRQLSMQEATTKYAPHLKTPKMLGAFGAGLLKATAWILRETYYQIDHGQPRDSTIMQQLWRERRALEAEKSRITQKSA